MKTLLFAASAMFLLASTSMAGIIGSTHNFSTSVTGATTITSTGAGAYTDPANATFCVGPNADNCLGSGLFGTYVFSDVTATLSQITFNFAGGTVPASGDFSVFLSDFANPGSTIIDVSLNSHNLDPILNFTFGVSWDGTTATFTGTPSPTFHDFAAFQKFATFDVTLTSVAPVPEPSTLFLLGTALVVFSIVTRKVRQRA